MVRCVNFVLLLVFALSTAALSTPHIRNVHHRRALAGRARDAALDEITATNNGTVVKRATNEKRCKQRPSSASSSTAKPTSSVPINVAPVPSISHSPLVVSSSTSHTTHTTSTTPAVVAAAPTPSSDSGEPSYMSGEHTGDGTCVRGSTAGVCFLTLIQLRGTAPVLALVASTIRTRIILSPYQNSSLIPTR